MPCGLDVQSNYLQPHIYITETLKTTYSSRKYEYLKTIYSRNHVARNGEKSSIIHSLYRFCFIASRKNQKVTVFGLNISCMVPFFWSAEEAIVFNCG